MAERTFTVSLPPGGQLGPAMRDAMVGAGEAIIYAWRQLVTEAGQIDTGEYLRRLTPQEALRYPYGDPLTVAIVNTAPHAGFLEYGRAGFHLPSHWRKWKTGKTGHQYAHVAFRIRTPKGDGSGGVSSSRGRPGVTMPGPLYTRVLERLRVAGDRIKTADLRKIGRPPGDYTNVRQTKSYHYYRQIFGDFPSKLSGPGYTWKTGQYEGMFFAGTHAGSHGQYYTIRTITPDSPGWFIPPSPAHHYAERALEKAAPDIQDMLQDAAAADLQVALLQAVEGLV